MRPELLPHLETFAEVAECGSFTAAARRLGITQAAVSQRVHLAEALLGVRLFHRGRDGVTLTDAGLRLHGYTRRVLDLTAEAWASVTGASHVLTGNLSLAASSVPGHHLLPSALAAFRKEHHAIQVRVSVSDTAAVVRELEHGHAHLGFVGSNIGNSHLEFRPFATDELVVVVPRQHSWWRKARVSVAELTAAPLIQRENGSASRRCLEQALERAGTAPGSINVAMELGSSESVKGAVLAGMGVAVLSRRAVRKELEAGQLRAVPVAGLTLERDLFFVRDRRRAMSAPAQRFLEFLHAPAATQP